MRGNPTQALSLYFHFPFCNIKCPYCHFSTFPNQANWKTKFLNSLFLEWERLLPHLEGRPIVSLYFGGGTPTLFPEGIKKVLARARSELLLTPTCEITVEANPECLTFQVAVALKQAGVNRLSVGIQSLDDKLLSTLGRSHTAQEGIDALLIADKVGLSNLSIDLMYEIPHQTAANWNKTLALLPSLPLSHLSLYNLTFEPHTGFYARKKTLIPHLPSEELSVALLKRGIKAFEAMGLKQYEISAFAKQGRHSLHNSGYWQGRPFFGLGPSAFSYINGKRFRNICSLPRYAQALNAGLSPIDFKESLPYPANVCELLTIRLRLLDGVDLPSFESTFAPLPADVHEKLTSLIAAKWLKQENGKIKLTELGLLFFDSIAEQLIVI